MQLASKCKWQLSDNKARPRSRVCLFGVRLDKKPVKYEDSGMQAKDYGDEFELGLLVYVMMEFRQVVNKHQSPLHQGKYALVAS